MVKKRKTLCQKKSKKILWLTDTVPINTTLYVIGIMDSFVFVLYLDLIFCIYYLPRFLISMTLLILHSI